MSATLLCRHEHRQEQGHGPARVTASGEGPQRRWPPGCPAAAPGLDENNHHDVASNGGAYVNPAYVTPGADSSQPDTGQAVGGLLG